MKLKVREAVSGEADDKLIELAQSSQLIILTEDKDFGEWIFAHHMQSAGVIFLRYHFKMVDTITERAIELLKSTPAELYGKFITVTISKIRSREI
ncbi:MAG: DUF5615 family PIN-like protein [Chitinophagales bacterium]